MSDQKREQLQRNLIERRQLLACLLSDEASDIAIDHNEDGRPYLVDYPEFAISFSDSEGTNALALMRSGYVGIDIEYIRPIGWEAMLSMMSDGEEAELIRSAIDASEESAVFLRCWTAKEAILKAVGTGLKGGAPRICLPEDFIAGQANQFRIEHDDTKLKVQSLQAGDIVLSRALSV